MEYTSLKCNVIDRPDGHDFLRTHAAFGAKFEEGDDVVADPQCHTSLTAVLSRYMVSCTLTYQYLRKPKK
jgi:hypothetical protein